MKKNILKLICKGVCLSASLSLLAVSIPKVSYAAEQTTVLNTTFENGTDNWHNFGDCSVSLNSSFKHAGNNSLYVSNRKAAWNGPIHSMNGQMKPGKTYNISAFWSFGWQNNYNETLRAKVMYKDNSGNTHYDTVCESTTSVGKEGKLNGTYTLPSGAKEISIYFESPQNLFSYYIDDISVAEISDGSSSDNNNNDNNNNDNNNNNNDNNNRKPIQSYTPPADFKNYKAGVNYGKINKITYYSSVTGANRKCNVFLPANYNSNKKYPVLYLLHGIGGTEDEWLQGAPNQIISNLIASGEAKEMIVVIPNIRASRYDGVPSNIYGNENVRAFDNFINDLRSCLMPYINKNYPVLTGRQNTAIAGLSMGGKESLDIGFKMLDTFGYIGAFSPAPGLDNPLSINSGSPTPYLVNVMCGDRDSVVHDIPNSYHNRLNSNHVKNVWYTVPGGDHNFGVWNIGLYNFARMIF